MAKQGPRCAGNNAVRAAGKGHCDISRGCSLHANAWGQEDPVYGDEVEFWEQMGGADDRSDRSDLARR
jgi:hypothetical protein